MEGAREISRRGGMVVIQDPKTCLCKETSEAAINKGGIQSIMVSDMQMAEKINDCFYE